MFFTGVQEESHPLSPFLQKVLMSVVCNSPKCCNRNVNIPRNNISFRKVQSHSVTSHWFYT
uniref:Uncharacterized protein n=1 Tax=Lepeophtheirus salmonis TaxID=72036 RepID=A0A0K2U3N2_LEPSM